MSGGSRSVWLGRLRLAALFVAIAAMVAASRPTVAAVATGAVVVGLGEALRLWAAGHLRKTVELVTGGPYRWVRNPLYLGRLLVWTGVCVMAPLPWSLHLVVLAAGWAVFLGFYLPRKERVEPARLSAIHGAAYDRYHAAVPALLPLRPPWPEGVSAGWSSERLLRNREHWMLAALVALTLVQLWRANAGGG